MCVSKPVVLLGCGYTQPTHVLQGEECKTCLPAVLHVGYFRLSEMHVRGNHGVSAERNGRRDVEIDVVPGKPRSPVKRNIGTVPVLKPQTIQKFPPEVHGRVVGEGGDGGGTQNRDSNKQRLLVFNKPRKDCMKMNEEKMEINANDILDEWEFSDKAMYSRDGLPLYEFKNYTIDRWKAMLLNPVGLL